MDKLSSQLKRKLITKNAAILEKTLDAFNIKARMVEINIHLNFTEYCIEVVKGTDLKDIEKRSQEIALAIASPSGKVKMLLPIPGKSLIGIHVPNYTKEQMLKILESEDLMDIRQITWKEKFGVKLLHLSDFIDKIGMKILRD